MKHLKLFDFAKLDGYSVHAVNYTVKQQMLNCIWSEITVCGFVGFWQFNSNKTLDISSIAANMAHEIAHRGPDSNGVWQDDHFPFVMAHQRLAIRDLSHLGAQPMHSNCGRYVIAYNGEIYNCNELLVRTPSISQSTNDTMTLIESLSQWGIEKTLSKINGMFAFALWDKQKKTLTLVRDRLGIKPLYFGMNRGVLFFGSQLKAFRRHPQWSPTIDQRALASYFRVNYINAPQTIYENIFKLQPGSYVVIDAKGKMTQHQYWSLLRLHQCNDYLQNEQEALHLLLKDAVKKRMIADVPLGAFLSGGIDSSAVVALMQSQSKRRINTFSIGFNETSFNEAVYAKKVAAHLGTDHHELYFSKQDAINLIPTLTHWFDEPFADSSQLPTLLVSQLAKQHVTVSLSGDGGDELFAGYPRYFIAYNLYKKLSILPKSIRAMIADGINSISPASWERVIKILPKKLRPNQIGDKAHKFSKILKQDIDDFYLNLVSLWQNPQELLIAKINEYPWTHVNGNNFIQKMQLLDTLTYLPEDILTKVDRASMAVSLETRTPILDHRVVEFAFQLPQNALIKNGKGKWILRNILKQYVPDKLVNRPKMGFGVPIDSWLRTSLREWAEQLLMPANLESSGLNSAPIREKWQQHLTGFRNWQYPLWGVLMYQLWYEKNYS